jgi:hypothetical protein
MLSVIMLNGVAPYLPPSCQGALCERVAIFLTIVLANCFFLHFKGFNVVFAIHVSCCIAHYGPSNPTMICLPYLYFRHLEVLIKP